MIKLISNTGLAEDNDLIDTINKINKECQRSFPKSVVATLLATEFNEVVAMDIKVFINMYILHLIDHVTRSSAAAIVKSKEKSKL